LLKEIDKLFKNINEKLNLWIHYKKNFVSFLLLFFNDAAPTIEAAPTRTTGRKRAFGKTLLRLPDCWGFCKGVVLLGW
jgi:hypothetical protein